MVSSDPSRPWVFIVPGDPQQKTGGYGYVRELVKALCDEGQFAVIRSVAGHYPRADQQALKAMSALLAEIPDDSLVVVDGLALAAFADACERHRGRLRMLALVHHPLADETGLSDEDRHWLLQAERRALARVDGIITTSSTTARGLPGPDRYRVDPECIRVVEPGVAVPEPVRREPSTAEPVLLCVAHLSVRKAQVDLVRALAALTDLPWVCRLVGSPHRDRDYAREVCRVIAEQGLTARIQVMGELGADDLAAAYRDADVFVLPSHYEGYGMVVDEAFAWGLPVVSSDGGALARTADRPGARLYPAGDSDALAGILRDVLTSPEQQEALLQGAMESRANLMTWQEAARRFQEQVRALVGTAAGSARSSDLTHFEETWLALRRPADHQARDPRLTAQAAGWLAQYEVPEVADLGTGTGSNYRYLAPRMPASTRWFLLDQDDRLLARLQEQLDPDQSVSIRQTHLSADALDDQIPESVGLITGSALIDLVSRNWLESLAEATAHRGAAVLMVLSYDGRFDLRPALGSDQKVRALINAHQHRDKGSGSAAGPRATEWLAEALRQRDYQVEVTDSPWQLDSHQAGLQRALLEGWVKAAIEQLGDCPEWLLEWQETRIRQIDAGELFVQVGHHDLFASPGKGS